MHIEATQTFVKTYKKLPNEVKEQAKKAIRLLASTPEHPSLHNKKMAGQINIFEIRVSKNYRITYSYQKSEQTFYLRKIGTHDLLRNP